MRLIVTLFAFILFGGHWAGHDQHLATFDSANKHMQFKVQKIGAENSIIVEESKSEEKKGKEEWSLGVLQIAETLFVSTDCNFNFFSFFILKEKKHLLIYSGTAPPVIS